MPWDVSDASEKDAALCEAISDMSAPMAKALDVITKGIDDNFASESAAGEGWKPLAASTVKERARLGYGGEHPILERDGVLRGAASAHRSSSHEDAEVGPDGVDYAKYHLGDGTGDGAKIPMRDFLVQTPATEDELEALILDHLEAASG